MKMFSFWGNQVKSWKDELFSPHMYNNNNTPNLKLFFSVLAQFGFQKIWKISKIWWPVFDPFLQGPRHAFCNNNKQTYIWYTLCTTICSKCFAYVDWSLTSTILWFDSTHFYRADRETEAWRWLFCAKLITSCWRSSRTHIHAVRTPSACSFSSLLLLLLTSQVRGRKRWEDLFKNSETKTKTKMGTSRRAAHVNSFGTSPSFVLRLPFWFWTFPTHEPNSCHRCPSSLWGLLCSSQWLTSRLHSIIL